MTIRDFLKEKFRDYFNNYLTVEKFAEHNEITTGQARVLLAIGKVLHNSDAENEVTNHETK